MGSIADVHFTANLDDSRLQVDAKRAGDKAGQTLGQSMSEKVKKAFSGQEFGKGIVQGLGLAGALGAANIASTAISKVTDVIGDAINNASDLNETVSKSNVIFGENASEVLAWGDTMGTEFGQSKRAALDMASTFAGLFSTVGLSLDDATDKAIALTELGSDLASFFNTDVAEATQALRSGLAGESEPLRRFNVFLSETAVAAKAAQLGMKKVNGAFTEGQKVTARYAIIMEQTGAAQGDFARTSDGLANSSKILAAEMENLSAELGEELLPLARDGIVVLLDLVQAIKAVADAFGTATTAAEDFQFAAVLASQGMTREQFEAIKAAKERAKAALDAAAAAKEAFKIERDAAVAMGSLALQGSVFTELEEQGKSAQKAVRLSSSAILNTIDMLRKGLSDDAQTAAAALYDPIIAALDLADAQAELRAIKSQLREKGITADQVKELNRRRQEVGKQLIELNGLILTYGTEAERISKTKAFLASGFWAEAYEGATPEQKAALDDWQLALRISIDSMESESRIGAHNVADEFGEGLRVGRRGVQSGAQVLVGGATGEFVAAANDARHYGSSVGAQFAAGIRAQQHAVEQAASKLAGAAGSYLKVSSPAEKGPMSKGGGPEGWGERVTETLAEGMRRQISEVLAAAQDIAGAASAGFSLPQPGYSLGAAAMVPTPGGIAVPSTTSATPVIAGGRVSNNYVTIEGAKAPPDPMAVVDALRRGQETGLIE